MKKNLFLLFCFYFFVIQAVIIGIIIKESYMYLLAVINLVAIILILVLYKAFGPEDEDTHKEKRSSALHEEKPHATRSFQHEVSKVKNISKKNGSIPTILGIFLAAMIYILLIGGSFGLKLIGSSVLALILLFLICLFTKSLKRFFVLLGTKILLIVLGLGIVVFGYQFASQPNESHLPLGTYIGHDISSLALFPAKIADVDDTFLLSGQGTLLGTGTETGDTATIQSDQGIIALELVDSPGDLELAEPVETPEIIPTGKSLYMADMIKYVLESHDIPLITTKDVKFTYVSYNNELYPYFRTAYSKALIGSSTNPTKLALCDTYIVMKGLLQGRPVTYTKDNVLQKFREYAKANNKLNGCTQGGVLKDTNL